MLRTIVLLSIIAISVLTSCNNKKTKEEPITENAKEIDKQTAIERGKYLVTLMDCNTCHTPMKMTDKGPQPDMKRLLSGYPSDRHVPKFDQKIVEKGLLFVGPDLTATMGPWGISFGGNLTPHETGMGTWSFEQFETAMRKGKYKGLQGSRPLLPPMPWQSYKNLTDEDLKAMFEYLQSILPVENIVPAAIPPVVK